MSKHISLVTERMHMCSHWFTIREGFEWCLSTNAFDRRSILDVSRYKVAFIPHFVRDVSMCHDTTSFNGKYMPSLLRFRLFSGIWCSSSLNDV